MARKKNEIEVVELLGTSHKIKLLGEFFWEALNPPEYLDLDEWSDKYRMLPSETSSEHGQWDTGRFPFLRKIMKCLSPSMAECTNITVMKGAQIGFTEMMINWLLYVADMFPSPIMYTQANDKAIEEFSKQKLKPSIDACEKIYYTLGEGKDKNLSDTITNKGFPGGYITLGPGNSETYTRSKSVGNAAVDEEDSYVLSSGGGGSPIKKIQKRMANFPDSKLYRASTPKIKETSTIYQAYKGGSEEQYYVPCPSCNSEGHSAGNMFVIKWEMIHWSKEIDVDSGLPVDIWLECPCCGEKINEKKKTWMLEHGDWFSVKVAGEDGADGELKDKYSVSDKVANRSFQISSLYSPYGFYSWRDVVSDWLEYVRTKDINLLQVFINETLGEPFTLVGQEIDHHRLAERREAYGGGYGHDVPKGGLVLTAGVDVQDDRLEASVVAWGMFDECWHVDYVVIPGDTSDMGDATGITADGQPSVWLLLDQYLLKRFRHQSGYEMPIEVTMVDTGHRGEQVHVFCRNRENRRVFPIKGKDGWGYGYWQASRKRHEKYGTFDYTGYVDEIKSKIYSMLSIEDVGAGFVHFPLQSVYGDKFFKGLVCETRKTKMVSGKKKLYWETPPGARNEPLDTMCYSFVARNAYPVNIEERARKVGVMISGENAKMLASMRGDGQKKKRVVKKRGSHGGV